ncbi:hypothetical protein ACQP3J_28260, partial [Escherichia coli]
MRDFSWLDDLRQKIYPKSGPHLSGAAHIKKRREKEAFAFCLLALIFTDKFICSVPEPSLQW